MKNYNYSRRNSVSCGGCIRRRLVVGDRRSVVRRVWVSNDERLARRTAQHAQNSCSGSRHLCNSHRHDPRHRRYTGHLLGAQGGHQLAHLQQESTSLQSPMIVLRNNFALSLSAMFRISLRSVLFFSNKLSFSCDLVFVLCLLLVRL